MHMKTLVPKLLTLILSVLSLFAIVTYNQPNYPVTWFDEGMALQGALNLTKYGQYAMRSSEGLRVLDQPLIANGPGVVIPISVVFHLWGIGLLQARILLAVYFVGTILFFFRITSSYFGNLAACMATFLLLAIPEQGLIFYGRLALGNVPALMYFLAGLYFFSKLKKKKSTGYAIASGICFGLTLVTKGQYWILIPALMLMMIMDALHYKQLGFKYGFTILLVALLPSLIWLAVQFLLLGMNNFADNLVAVKSSASVTVFAFRSERIPSNIWYLIRSGFMIFVLPGLVVAARGGFHRTMEGLFRFFVIIFIALWLVWYLFVSVGWHRYAFEAHSLGMIFAGDFFSRISSSVLNGRKEFGGSSLIKKIQYGGMTLLLIIASYWGIKSFEGQIQRINKNADRTPQMFAEYLMANVPSRSIIESWEWELDLLTPELIYHHPTNDWVDRETARIQFGDGVDINYDPLIFEPEYLIAGPFSKWTGIYSGILADDCCIHIATIGEYTLFKINSTANQPKENGNPSR